jgi:hypothetical protein
MAITLVLMLMAGAAGYLIGDYKRRPVLGAVVGFLFGLLGIAAVMLIPRRRMSQPEGLIADAPRHPSSCDAIAVSGSGVPTP